MTSPADLKHWRVRHGLTQPGMAQLLDVDAMTVSRWETGTRSPPCYFWLVLWAIDHGALAEPHGQSSGVLVSSRQ